MAGSDFFTNVALGHAPVISSRTHAAPSTSSEDDGRGGRTKAPANGFLLFLSDFKAVAANRVAASSRKKKPMEITKDAAAAWRALTVAERKVYLTRARLNLEQHKREHRVYWSQRRGRDGRFVRIPSESDDVQPPPAQAQLSGSAGPSPDPPSAQSPQAPSPVGSFPTSWPSPGSFPFLPDNSLSFLGPAHDPTSVVTSAATPAVHYNHVHPVYAASHLPSLDVTNTNLETHGHTSLEQLIAPLQPSMPSMHDYSSRTLTLSSSYWKTLELLGFVNPSAPARSPFTI